MRHLLNDFDLSASDLEHLLTEAVRLKKAWKRGKREPVLAGRVLGMVFEKPSLRTRASFQSAMAQIGGTSLFFSATDGALGKRESVPDFSRTMSQFVDAVVLRVFHHATAEEFAKYSSVPVINGLSDLWHPCQALGDLLTMKELFGDLKGRSLVFVGDGNNVARSLAVVCGKLGVRFVLTAPKEHRFADGFLRQVREQVPGAEVSQESDPVKAVRKADVVYTDVWTSMGQEEESALRKKRFASFQVNEALMAKAPAHAKIMHCLPAHRGEEVSESILDGDQSVVFEEAGNRMHAQKALLKWLLT